MIAKTTQDSTATDEAREIVGLFRSLRRHLVRGSRAELARSGLTAAQVSVISLLGTNGAMTLGDLSRELELSHSTVSGIVDRLQAKDLVVRKPNPEDRRYVQISLANHVASQAPALGDEGPIARL
jgi:DNA-binding MarR family transcriptional regulator